MSHLDVTASFPDEWGLSSLYFWVLAYSEIWEHTLYDFCPLIFLETYNPLRGFCKWFILWKKYVYSTVGGQNALYMPSHVCLLCCSNLIYLYCIFCLLVRHFLSIVDCLFLLGGLPVFNLYCAFSFLEFWLFYSFRFSARNSSCLFIF